MASVPISRCHHRTVVPCLGCSDRTIICHSTCERYADWSNDDKAKSADARRKHTEYMITQDYVIKGHLERKKGVIK